MYLKYHATLSRSGGLSFKFVIMKKLANVVVFLLVSFISVAQQSEVRSVGSFSGVKAGEAIDVYLKKGDKESVRVETSGTDASNVITEVSGSYLKIHMKDGRYRNRDIKVYVTYVSINKISASSASNIFSEGTIKSSSLDVSVSSAGSVEVTIETESAVVEVSSAGDVVLEGKAKKLEAEASSAGEIDAYNLESEVVNASASSAGSIKVNVSTQLEAHASSGGSVRYRGTPHKTNTGSSSGGSVKKSN
jgi:Putative auto-transporter adhesin, head GIN domain